MTLKSSRTAYGAVPITLHWLTAILVFTLFATGFGSAANQDPTIKSQLLRIHAPCGVAVLVLTLFRILWWRAFDTHPEPLTTTPHWQEACARAVHLLFYVLLLGMAASGFWLYFSSGVGRYVFGHAAGAWPEFADYAARIPHALGGICLVLLVIVHAGAALQHQFIKRDGLINRMSFRRGTEPAE